MLMLMLTVKGSSDSANFDTDADDNDNANAHCEWTLIRFANWAIYFSVQYSSGNLSLRMKSLCQIFIIQHIWK